MSTVAEISRPGRPSGIALTARLGGGGLARRRLVLGLLTLSAAWIGLVAPAATAGVTGTPAWSAAVVAPRDFALVRGGAVQVVVRLRSGVTSVRVTVRRRAVTGAFRRRGTERIARLRVGHGVLRWGANEIVVRTADRRRHVWFSRVQVIMLRSGHGMVRGWSGRRLGSSAAADTVLRVRVGRLDLVVWAWINGRRRPLALPGPGRLRARSLDGDEGLRPGTNQVRVEAIDPNRGTYTRWQLTLRLSPRVPVAGAGPARRGPVRRMLIADAGATRAASPGSILRYRWQIVRRPRGSRARLLRPTSRRPGLRPDRRGRYVLRLTVTERPRRGVKPRRSGLATTAQATDDVTFTATPAAGPIGVPIDTIATGPTTPGQTGPGVNVGGTFYPWDGKAPLQLVALDRTSLELLVNKSYGDDSQGAQALENEINALQGADNLALPPLVIITKPDPALTSASPDAGAVQATLGAIGATVANTDVLIGTTGCVLPKGGQCSSFSAVGVPGLPSGQAPVNPGLGSVPATGAPAGDLHGFLQQDAAPITAGIPTATDPAGGADPGSTPNADQTYSFINRERVPFDTGDPNADPAVVTVGGTPYKSENVPASPGGFLVVVLDAGTLIPRLQPAQATFVNSYTSSAPDLRAMTTYLSSYTSDPTALVIVRTVGKVSRIPTGWWDQVGIELGKLGGSRYYLNYLDGGSGSSSLAQIGVGGGSGDFPSDTTQLASYQRNGSARLSGLLARSASSQLFPAESTSLGDPLDNTFNGLISDQSATAPWPNEATAGERAASNCIAGNLLTPGHGVGTPLESAYTDTSIIWSDHVPAFSGALSYASLTQAPDNCTGFKPGDLTAVQKHLTTIWPAVDAVEQALIPRLQAPYLGNGSGPVYSAVHAVNDTVDVQSQPVSTDWTSVASDVLWIAGSFEGPLAGLLNAASAGVALESAFIQEPNGSPALTDVTIRGDMLASALSYRYLNAAKVIGREGDIIVSDWGKLQSLYANTAPNDPFATTTSTPSDLITALNASESRQAFRSLFPARYALYRTQKGPDAPAVNNVTLYRCEQFSGSAQQGVYEVVGWQPFAGDPKYAGSSPPTTAGGALEQWAYAAPGFDAASVNSGQPTWPTTNVLTAMFAPTEDSQGNVLAPQLFTTENFPLEAYNAGAKATAIVQQNATAGTFVKATTSELCVPGSSDVSHARRGQTTRARSASHATDRHPRARPAH